MDLILCLEKMWDRIQFPKKLHSPLTILHGSSHLIKASIKQIKTFTSDEKIQTLLRAAMGLLIHTTDLKDGLNIFGKVCNLFGRSKKCDNHDTYLKELIGIKTLDLLSGTDTNTELGDLEESLVLPKTQRQQSKFYLVL